MKLSLRKRINTTPNSIYSLIKYNNEIVAFGRRHEGERVIKKLN